MAGSLTPHLSGISFLPCLKWLVHETNAPLRSAAFFATKYPEKVRGFDINVFLWYHVASPYNTEDGPMRKLIIALVVAVSVGVPGGILISQMQKRHAPVRELIAIAYSDRRKLDVPLLDLFNRRDTLIKHMDIAQLATVAAAIPKDSTAGQRSGEMAEIVLLAVTQTLADSLYEGITSLVDGRLSEEASNRLNRHISDAFIGNPEYFTWVALHIGERARKDLDAAGDDLTKVLRMFTVADMVLATQSRCVCYDDQLRSGHTAKETFARCGQAPPSAPDRNSIPKPSSVPPTQKATSRA